ncbi:uncharacterized protein LOC117057976 [Lacerta agilis]|uniref:uncharacterized protein LOC117057976 n=1 Tax=Lacerta agilis TaxID=80427 RepID=UPI00141A4339|nr:uncharacterized protein LOC117057976 [Lacerta agilis]
MLQICLIWLVSSFFEESSGQIVITQTPASLQANLGDRVTILCRASSSVGSNMNLYEVKPGKKPKLLIYYASNRFGGTPDRFSGSQSGNDFSFTINGVRAEDVGEYYCGQSYSFPLHSDTIQYKNQLSSLKTSGRDGYQCFAAAPLSGRTFALHSGGSTSDAWHFQLQEEKQGAPVCRAAEDTRTVSMGTTRAVSVQAASRMATVWAAAHTQSVRDAAAGSLGQLIPVIIFLAPLLLI